MDERSRLYNGRFLHNLNNWTGAGGAAYSAGDGDEHYGVAVLPAGASIAQTFGVTHLRAYTLHVAAKPVGGTLGADELVATITDGAGNVVAALSLEGDTADSWQENSDTLGLAPGTTYTLELANGSGLPVRVDDVWLWYVPVTRAALAAAVHAKLSRLATQASLSTAASGASTEGDYTAAVSAGLRTVGAIDPETDLPDVRWLEASTVDACQDAIEREMLERLQRYYAVETDLTLGPKTERRSQIAGAIEKLTGTAGGPQGGSGSPGKIVTRQLRRETNDYELG